jgi:hypothetical protein
VAVHAEAPRDLQFVRQLRARRRAAGGDLARQLLFDLMPDRDPGLPVNFHHALVYSLADLWHIS